MKINFVLPRPTICGCSRVIAIFSEELTKMGHEVNVYYKAREKFWLLHKLLIFLGSKRYYNIQSYNLFFLKKRNIKLIKYEDKSFEKKLSDADIIVVSYWSTAKAIKDLPENKGRKLYYIMDYGGDGQPYDLIVPTWNYPLRRFSISKSITRKVAELSNTKEIIPCVYPGINDIFINKTERNKQTIPTIGYMYRGETSKGSKLFIDAMQIVKKSIPNLAVHILGPGKPTDEIQKICDGKYLHKPSDEMLSEIYKKSDLWIFSSYLEGLGLPILEAMASGTPVISTDVGDAREFLSQGGGAVLNSFSEQELADKVIEFFTYDDKKWKEISNQAMSIASNLTWEKATDKMLKIFEES